MFGNTGIATKQLMACTIKTNEIKYPLSNLNLMNNGQVTHLKLVHSFDIFSLLVELGEYIMYNAMHPKSVIY